MDNVTHTIAGLIAAEALLAARDSARLARVATYGRMAWVTSALANNLPDADLLYSLVDPTPLGYLLHHRGHTHTLALGLPLGLLALLVPWLWARRGKHALGREGWGLLVALALVGPFVHLTLDSSNNYGVHPFWPVWNGWLYGDTLFIIEPLFWVCGLTLLLPSMRTRLARAVTGVLLLAILAVCWAVPFVPWPLALGLTLLAAGLLAAGWRRTPHMRMGAALGLSLLTVGAFALGSAHSRNVLQAGAQARYPGWTVHDAVLTPLPSNPLCWEAVLVMSRGEAPDEAPDEAQYALRRAQVAAWPGLLPVARCPELALARPTTLPLQPLSPRTDAVAWRGEHVAPLARMRRVFQEHCEARAFLRFARAPFLLE
ncbi:MAG TPA: metal-dependent hydrolase, partial [Aggregicoccus sp.]|nr:metal-dependent hydrolase [Aggregicoccus sp.]